MKSLICTQQREMITEIRLKFNTCQATRLTSKMINDKPISYGLRCQKQMLNKYKHTYPPFLTVNIKATMIFKETLRGGQNIKNLVPGLESIHIVF